MKWYLYFLCLCLTIKSHAQISQAINSDGIDDFVDPNTLVTSVFNNFTFEVWARPTSTHEVDPESMSFNNRYAGLYNQKYLLWPTWRNNDAGIGISVGINGVSVYEHGREFMNCILAWQGNLNAWTHIAVTINNKQPILYINGLQVKVGLTSLKNQLFPSLGECGQYGPIVGGIGGGTYGYYRGEIDELRIWKNIRSQGEISSNMGIELNCVQGLLAYYKFNNGLANANNSNATSALDYSGNNYTANLLHFALVGSISNWISPGPVLGVGGGAAINLTSSSGYTLCYGQSTTLTASGAPSYTWSNGSNNASIVVSPASTAVYSVLSPASACSSGTANVLLNVVPDLNLSQKFYSMCYGQSVNLQSNATSFSVFNANGQSVTATVSPSVTSVYTVQLTSSGVGYSCNKTLTTQVIVNENPIPNFTHSLNPCGGGVYFKDSSQAGVKTWQWQLTAARTSSIQNPYYFYGNGGSQTVQLTVSNNFGCTATIKKMFQVLLPPPVSISNSLAICIGDTAELQADGGFAYQWSPNFAIDDTDVDRTKVHPTTSTEYSVIIDANKISTGQVCHLLLTVLVQVDQLSVKPATVISSTPQVIIGDACYLTYQGDEGAKVTWQPVTIPNEGYLVQAFPEKATTYTTIASKGVCTQSFTTLIEAYTAGCNNLDFFVPNTFTPNGDGQNDVLMLRGKKAEKIHFIIYNRWGELIFESFTQQLGWDGLYQGKMSEAGVYAWFAELICVNGGITKLKGNINLIR